MIDHIAVVSWYIQLLQEGFYTGSQTRLLLSKDPIMFGLINIIIASPLKTSTLQVIYSFNNILKVFFVVQTSSTIFHVKLILHPLNFVIQQFSNMKLSYLLLEIKLVLNYFMMNILPSFMSLVQSQIRHPVVNFQHMLRKICGSFISI